MRFWFDTEFYEDGKTIELISIGLVSEDGREYYAETPDAETLCAKSAWLIANVQPHLVGATKTKAAIATDLTQFMGEKPEIWAYYADYDWVVLCQLYGRMIDLPKGWPMFCRDVRQLAEGRALPKLGGNEHHALADARWAKGAWEKLNGRY